MNRHEKWAEIAAFVIVAGVWSFGTLIFGAPAWAALIGGGLMASLAEIKWAIKEGP